METRQDGLDKVQEILDGHVEPLAEIKEEEEEPPVLSGGKSLFGGKTRQEGLDQVQQILDGHVEPVWWGDQTRRLGPSPADP
jgi:predicted RNase H-like HicB family nuclease